MRRQKKKEEKSQEKAAEPEEEVSGKSAGLEQAQAERVALAQVQKQKMMDHRQALRKLKKSGASEEEIRKFDQEFEKALEEQRKREVEIESQENRNS